MKSHQIKRIQPFSKTKTQDRGWTLDVLNAIRRLTERGSVTRSTQLRDGTSCDSQSRAPSEFTTAEVYTFTRELERLHPDNSDIHREQAATYGIKSASNFNCCATLDY